jgi:uncharacterized protein with PIN domain
MYIMHLIEKSVCPQCHKHVELLCEEYHIKKGLPAMFYICFDCRKVYEVGVGEVKRA